MNRRHLRALIAALTLAALLSASPEMASAQDTPPPEPDEEVEENPFGGDDDQSRGDDTPDDTGGVEVESGITVTDDGQPVAEATSAQTTDMTSNREAARSHAIGPDHCLEWSTPPAYVDVITGELRFPPSTCDIELDCDAERVDDLAGGDLSGALSSSDLYARFFDQMISGQLSWFDIGGLINSIVTLVQMIGEPPTPEHLPVFHGCVRSNDGLFEVDDPVWGARISWETTIVDEYPIDDVRNDLTQRVVARLRVFEPDLDGAPPLDLGYTYVRFPTWLWVNDPLDAVHRYAYNDLSTILVEVRATLTGVEWHLGDRTLFCELDEMIAFAPEAHDPLDDAPTCHHIEDTLDGFTLSADLIYDVQERIAVRLSPSQGWSNDAWQPHPTSPTVTVTTDLGQHEVHQVLALNVNPTTSD